MYLKLDQQRLSTRMDEQSILEILREAAAASQDFVSIHQDEQEFLQVALGTDQPLTMLRAKAGEQAVIVPDPVWPLDKVARLFARYAAADPAWEGMISWDQSVQGRMPAEAMARGWILARKLAKTALGLVAVLLTAAGVFGDLPVLGALKLFAAVLAVGSYLRWVTYAGFTARPAVAKKLGDRFGVVIVEGGDIGFDTSGQWKIVGDAPVLLRVALPFIDIGVALSLFFLPFALGAPVVVFVLNGFHF